MLVEITLGISILSLISSILTIWIFVVKLKSIYLNLWNMSRGMDVLFENDNKIIELTKIKGFIQLTNEEEQTVRKEISTERTKSEIRGNKKVEKLIRPSDSNPDDERQ